MILSEATRPEQIRLTLTGKDLIKRSTGEVLGRVTISIGVPQLHLGESAQPHQACRRLPLRCEAPRPQSRDLRDQLRSVARGICGIEVRSDDNSPLIEPIG